MEDAIGRLFEGYASDADAAMTAFCPGEPDADGHRSQPFFLFDLDRTSILDMLHNRLLFLVVVRRALLSRMLSSVGIQLETRTGEPGFSGESFVLVRRRSVANGFVTQELHSFGQVLSDLISALRPAENFVARADQVLASVPEECTAN